MESSKKGISKKFVVGLIVASILIVTLIIVSFIMFFIHENNKDAEFFDSGSIVMTYAENSDIFFINNILPMTDEVGKANSNEGQYYDFTINVNLGDCDKSSYEIALEISDEFTTALPSTVKVYLEKQESGSYIPVGEPVTFDKLQSNSLYGAPKDAKIIASVNEKETVSNNYRLRMWLADGTVVSPEILQSFGIEINVYGEAK